MHATKLKSPAGPRGDLITGPKMNRNQAPSKNSCSFASRQVLRELNAEFCVPSLAVINPTSRSISGRGFWLRKLA